ncbi:barstar family protein [Nocardia sp. NPDC057668]|uniref:barstar family protein n=1 Tax=Nocardia sp. NPDC057668 TaxID=3346202 RepID=UPI0036710A6C
MATPISLSQFLSRPADPVLGALRVKAPDFSGLRYRLPRTYASRELRAGKMRTVAGVFDEFAAALQFPYYFGENKDAFDECLRDLAESLGEAEGYVLLVRDAADLLADQPGELEWFASAMTDCATYWSGLKVHFRVVLQGEVPDLSTASLDWNHRDL